jgi:hypothetical protein
MAISLSFPDGGTRAEERPRISRPPNRRNSRVRLGNQNLLARFEFFGGEIHGELGTSMLSEWSGEEQGLGGEVALTARPSAEAHVQMDVE